MRIDSAIITGSFSVNGDTFNDLGSYSTTGSNTFVGNQSIVGAVSASALTGSINFTNLTGVPTLVSGSEQIVGILSPLNSYTQSNDTTNTTQNTRLSNLENKTGSLATTGSNTFIGNQTISGTVYIQDDLIVQGSSSLQNITASAVSIGTNIVNLNTANPSIRFAGLSIVDSGSVGGSGSFLYDSLQDEFIFVHRGAATAVTSSVILMGPQTYDSIGSETYLTNNQLVKGVGNEHLADSNISDTGTLVSVNSPTIFLSGSVGIGTTNPGEKLTINGSIGIQRNGTQIWHTSVDSSNNLQFTRSGIAERMTISSDGLVGIGTMVPSNILHLYGTDGNSYLRWTSNVATTGARIGYNGSEFRIDQQQNADITFRTNGSEKLKIASGGDILISNNGKFLQAVRNTGGAIIDIIGIQSGTDTLQIKGGTSGGTNAINFYDTGGLIGTFYNSNLGIGITSPFTKLTVNGVVSAINSGVDATFTDAFVGVYSSNNNEQNAIQTSVSSVAQSSGFRFQVSNGGGSTGRTNVVDFRRDRALFYTNVGIGTDTPSSKLHILDTATSSGEIARFQRNTDALNEYSYIRVGNGSYPAFFGSMLGTYDVAYMSMTENPTQGKGIYVRTVDGNVGIGVTNPSKRLTVDGRMSTTAIVSNSLIAGNIYTNISTSPSYILICDLNNIAGFSMSGKVNAASYTCWNISDIWIKKDYSSTTAAAGITGEYKSGCDFSIVDISYGGGRYIALRFTSNPEIDVMFTGYRLNELYQSDGTATVATSGVTVNGTYASY